MFENGLYLLIKVFIGSCFSELKLVFFNIKIRKIFKKIKM